MRVPAAHALFSSIKRTDARAHAPMRHTVAKRNSIQQAGECQCGRTRSPVLACLVLLPACVSVLVLQLRPLCFQPLPLLLVQRAQPAKGRPPFRSKSSFDGINWKTNASCLSICAGFAKGSHQTRPSSFHIPRARRDVVRCCAALLVYWYRCMDLCDGLNPGASGDDNTASACGISPRFA